MHVSQLKEYIPQEFIKKISRENIKTLYPAQAEAINKGIFSGESLVISTPTASGKTLIASLAMINSLLGQKGKAVYIVPLVALASEKYRYYKEFFKGHLKVALSVGDLDSQDPWLSQYRLVIATSEKLDSLIRHGATWIDDIKLVIVDEIHLLNDYSRGPTLEVLITLLKRRLRQAQFLALSATVNNGMQLSCWLGSRLIESDFRPVKLYEGVNFESSIDFVEKKPVRLARPQELGIAEDTVRKIKKQLLVFVATRRSSESLAERLGKYLHKGFDKDELKDLDNLSQRILQQLEQPTHQCRKLADAVRRGVAFHHAGLLSGQKSIIEDGFRSGLIKVICATPTLALGVNLPAFRVLVRDIKRYYPGSGSVDIPVLEYKQFIGRAGRPQYDKFGESILFARSKEEADDLIEKYILGVPEDIESKLAQESSLRIYSLSLVATGIALSLSGLLKFFAASFFGYQYKDINLIEEKIRKILLDLEAWGFIVKEKDQDRFRVTRLGARVSQLYLDPCSAFHFIEALRQAESLGLTNLGILQGLCYVDEMHPNLKLKAKELSFLNEVVNRNKEFILMDVPLMWDDNYQDFLRSIKSALSLEAWINEASENQLLDEFQITPGELHKKLEIADWLLYCIIEIAVILKRRDVLSFLRRLRVRINYGVREELLALVTLRDIGRVRSRRLFSFGIKEIKDLKATPQKKLAVILGPKIAQRVVSQIKAD